VRRVWVGGGLASAAAIVAAWIAIGVGGGSGGGQFCPPFPAFPDANCTGVPAGVTFTTPALDSDHNYVINVANTVVDGVDMHATSPSDPMGCIIVKKTGVTIKNSKVRCIVTENEADAPGATPRLKIEDTEVDCQRSAATNQGSPTGIFWQNFDALRVDIQRCENGLDMEMNASLQDSYIHNLSQCATPACIEPDAHTDGIQSGNSSGLVIKHNNISVVNLPCGTSDGSCAGTGSINLNHNPLTGTFTNTLVSQNLLLGGSAWIYCPQATTVSWVVTKNHLSNAWTGVNPQTDGCANEDAGDNVIHETGAHFGLG